MPKTSPDRAAVRMRNWSALAAEPELDWSVAMKAGRSA
jgi:hypothetical protein